ncbi:MAG: hypothetical protein A3J28_16630 [Acidobacteria bacterium RIFCSPLOWO2_12_FULL_60_22]|nr:MAG: hypothetical protein A3J28_16630 [Acidobacteria bacterium RIFCSPLOWO2_12_FULL_60_22]
MYNTLSAFYLELWRHLDGFFDENRWLRTDSVPPVDERLENLKSAYEAISSVKIGWGVPLARQIRRDFEDVERLTKEYCLQKPQPCRKWFKDAEKMRSYCQELGLRYAELAVQEQTRVASA